MHALRFFFSVGLISLFLTGCSQSPVSTMSPSSSSTSSSSTNSAQVSLSITDEPPTGVTVLFFQISLTSANLTPASGSSSISLLSNNTPIQVDVTQLQAISAFLSTANVPAETYNSLSLTFANPQLVIFNASDQAIASTCPVNATCQLTPKIDNSSTLTFSAAPFPVTVAQNTPLGFLLDFHLDQVIQSDLSVDLSATNGVTVAQLPSAPPMGPSPFGFLLGTVESVNSGQNEFTLQTRFGRTFTIDVNSGTSYQNFPSTVCTTSNLSCVATGQIVKVQVASVESDGNLLAAQVSYIQTAAQEVVEGNIIGLSASNGTTVMNLLLHWSPDSVQFPFGGIASVTIAAGATFSVDSGNFTIPKGLSFASTSDLLVGQEVQVSVAAGSLSNSRALAFWAPPSLSFTTSSVELEPSQVTGTVTSVNASGSSFTITTFPNFFSPWLNSTWPNWRATLITVQATSQTAYQDFSPDSFSGVSNNNVVSVQGWLFSTPSGATPTTLLADTVLGRPERFF